ncbi:MAG: hypothetical protein MUO30_04885 [Anaerolineales bacterium]|nr:hypothetical protein [Anaerolineales bacterium]
MQKIYAALFSDLSTRGRFDLAQALRDGAIRVNQIGSLGRLKIPLTLRDTWQWSTAVLCLRPLLEKVKRNYSSIRIVFEEC